MKSLNIPKTYDSEWQHTVPKLIDLDKTGKNPLGRFLLYILKSPLENALSLKDLNRTHEKYCEKLAFCKDHKAIFHLALESLKVTCSISDADLQKIPTKGPLVVVANHPFGGIEGVVLGAVLLKVRPDLKILGNYLLNHISGICDTIIPVDPFDNRQSVASNLKGLKEAIRWVKDGGALVTFPAGEVSSLNLKQRRVVDPTWSPHIGGIVRRARATALPVYFPGKNGLAFQTLGLLHPLLRTALLPRELVNKKNTVLNVYVGKPIGWKKLQRFETDAELVDYLRINTDFIKNRVRQNKKRPKSSGFFNSPDPAPRPIIEPVLPLLLKKDVAALPAEQRLVQNGDYAVYIARSSQIPNVLNEIGRLREITFREVQEGTGNPIDLDHFDSYYLHLFIWNLAKEELVGAYRLGLADEIIKTYGRKGLYTSTLFRFKPDFDHQLANAIEAGRSFVRSEYQKKFNSMVLLWRGISEFFVRNPHYKILFGPVSISRDYHTISKNLIVKFLKTNNFNAQLSRLVRPRNSYRSSRVEGVSSKIIKSSFQDIDDISLLISEIENDSKGVPVLLRHYLKLNGSLISFNADKSFSSVVDGLLLVDLTKTDSKLLRRFMGEKGFETFTRHHQALPEANTPISSKKNLTL
ncbi:MAG: lysophospholipid acyltransferase family protein [Desulfobacterales bacterium]|jgi:putative hemolysin